MPIWQRRETFSLRTNSMSEPSEHPRSAAKRRRHGPGDSSGHIAAPSTMPGPSSAAAPDLGTSRRMLMLEEYRRHWKGAWEDTRCLQTLGGHSDTVTAVAVLDADRIVSGSSDRTLKVWSATDRRRHMAVLQINRHWREAISNPERKLCRKLLARQYEQ